MPFGNGMGPQGFGPMTGRGAGYCAGNARPGYANRFIGGGRGFRNRFFASGAPYGGPAYGQANPWAAPAYSSYDPAVEKEGLANRAAALEGELKALRARLTELESDAKES